MHRGIVFAVFVLLASACPSTTGPDGGARTSLGLNEVTLIVPLPKSPAEYGAMLSATEQGLGGRLVPDFVVPAPALLQNEERATSLENLRVVALRTSPCDPYVGEKNLANCQRVLHVMLQPVTPSSTGFTTADAALHVMYRLDSAQYETWLSTLVELARAGSVNGKAPLQPHPALAKEGLTGATWKKVRATVLSVAGQANVERMAFMALRASLTETYFGRGWLFAGSDFHDNAQHRVVVATTTDSEQHFGNNSNGSAREAEEQTWLGDFIPETRFNEALLPVVRDTALARTAPVTEIQHAVDQALELENPLSFTLDSADCVSCHVAGTAREWAMRERGVNIEGNSKRYLNADFDLTNVSEGLTLTNNLRGVGYYGSKFALSQRTINDTAASASFINANDLRDGVPVHRDIAGHQNGASVHVPWTRAAPLLVPPGTTSMSALITDAPGQRLLGSSGTRLFAWSLADTAAPPSTVVDLAPQGLSSIDALVSLTSGGLLALGSNQAVTLTGAGALTSKMPLVPPPFSGASWAASANGKVVVAVEGGSGSADADGVVRAHVAWWDLSGPAPLQPTVLSLKAPFRIAPPEVGAINAASPLVSPDGSSVLLFHVIYRTGYRLDLASGALSIVDHDSLNRSVTSVNAGGPDLVTEVASFDQTVAVFKALPDAGFKSLVELPSGLNLGAVATDGQRVFVVRGGALTGGFPAPGADGGFPFPVGDGGFPGFPPGGDGGFTFPGLGGSDAGLSIEVFALDAELVR